MFGEKTAEEWEKHTRSLVKREVDGLLVDVRGNPGGYLHSVEAIASTMLDKGANYAYMQDAEGVLEPLTVVGQKEDAYIKSMRKMPLVLLQDEGSASASEVLSGALKSNKRALIAGTKSFGKGTVQETWDLSNGGEIKLSSHKWLTPSQEWIHGSGIKVDFLVESNELFQLNPQISTGTYQVGEYHEDVAYAQKVLKALGHSISRVDGYFDEDTAKAIEQFSEKEMKNASPEMNPEFFQHLRQKVVTFKSSKKMMINCKCRSAICSTLCNARGCPKVIKCDFWTLFFFLPKIKTKCLTSMQRTLSDGQGFRCFLRFSQSRLFSTC